MTAFVCTVGYVKCFVDCCAVGRISVCTMVLWASAEVAVN
jgi:hypothetical protein